MARLPLTAYTRRCSPRPWFGVNHSEWSSVEGDGEARMHEEAVFCACQPADAVANTIEFQRRRVVQDQDALVHVAPHLRAQCVRRVDGLELDVVVVEEPVQGLQLAFIAHRFGEAQLWVLREGGSDSLQPAATTCVSEGSIAVLELDSLVVHAHAIDHSSREITTKLCGVLSPRSGLTAAKPQKPPTGVTTGMPEGHHAGAHRVYFDTNNGYSHVFDGKRLRRHCHV
jgi:hypothetical protein